MEKIEEIRKELEKIMEKFDDPQLKERFKNFSRDIQFSLPDLAISFLIIVKNGHIESISQNTIVSPDIHLTLDSNILLDIINKKIDPMIAFTTGKIKAKGKLTDLLKISKIL